MHEPCLMVSVYKKNKPSYGLFYNNGFIVKGVKAESSVHAAQQTKCLDVMEQYIYISLLDFTECIYFYL
jgi:hypothetical protein